jgi:thiosulfate/3-mercaptopyruvate sulfurtransferase
VTSIRDDDPHGENMLISAAQLAERLPADDLIVFDCRFDLQHATAGRDSWLAAHIPGAVYAHTDNDLSGPVTPASGRHPLPAAGTFAEFLARSGWRMGMTAVVYDAHGGAFAARFWWLMRFFGLGEALLLDGGIRAWSEAALPMDTGKPGPGEQPVVALEPRLEMILDANGVEAALADDGICLIDARAADRFEGLAEPIDAVAGHVPGARNHPYSDNLGPDMRFRAPRELELAFSRLTAGYSPEQCVHMCGSGVTACHNIFAMELAGLPGSRLYAGSWSEWIREGSRPVGVGPARS